MTGSSISTYLSQRRKGAQDCRLWIGLPEGLEGCCGIVRAKLAWRGDNGLLVGEVDVGWPFGRPKGSSVGWVERQRNPPAAIAAWRSCEHHNLVDAQVMGRMC